MKSKKLRGRKQVLIQALKQLMIDAPLVATILDISGRDMEDSKVKKYDRPSQRKASKTR